MNTYLRTYRRKRRHIVLSQSPLKFKSSRKLFCKTLRATTKLKTVFRRSQFLISISLRNGLSIVNNRLICWISSSEIKRSHFFLCLTRNRSPCCHLAIISTRLIARRWHKVHITLCLYTAIRFRIHIFARNLKTVRLVLIRHTLIAI